MIKWKGYTWETQESWGIIHPNYPYQYTDEECVDISKGQLILHTKRKPRSFALYPTNPQWARGLVMCMDKFHFGRYTIIATLPTGKNLWPAIWLYGQESWPPEIDIMEAYSNSKGSYFNLSTSSFRSFFHSLLRPYKIEANYHISTEGGVGTERVRLGYIPDLTDSIVFTMEWTEAHIIMRANGRIYSKVEGNVMEHFQQPMRFLINNGIRKGGADNASESQFSIYHFHYTPYFK